jgi:hypothetical protein
LLKPDNTTLAVRHFVPLRLIKTVRSIIIF